MKGKASAYRAPHPIQGDKQKNKRFLRNNNGVPLLRQKAYSLFITPKRKPKPLRFGKEDTAAYGKMQMALTF